MPHAKREGNNPNQQKHGNCTSANHPPANCFIAHPCCQTILSRTDGYTVEAGDAFCGFYSLFFHHGNSSWADGVALAARYARITIAMNMDGAEGAEEAKKCAVWAEVAAPEAAQQDTSYNES